MEYNSLNSVSAEYFYIQLLSEIKLAVLSDDVDRFKILSGLLNYVFSSKSSDVMQEYKQKALEALGKINLITLACKTKAMRVLEYLLSDQNENFVLPFQIDRSEISPEEEDDESQNACYYAIRSNDNRLLETLIHNWPNSCCKNTEKLDEILSKAFNELMVRNVPLTQDMELYVKKKLVDLRFFQDSTSQQKPGGSEKDLLLIRIEFILEKIDFVVASYCDDKNELDEQFLLTVKFVAQNIHTIKSKLNFTYDRLPLEEMEFCLIVFIRFCLKAFSFEPLYYFVLNKHRLLSHLDKFSKRLESVKEELKVIDISKVPGKKIIRKEVIDKDENKSFKELFDDFTEIRDLYTLEKIKKYTNIALSADPRTKEGHIIITRALQVTGEHFNNTPTSPKLSDTTADFLLSVLPRNVAEIITSLRNSLSHLEAFCLRCEIEKNANTFFANIQADIAKISATISDILYRKKITVIKTLLNRMIGHEYIESRKTFFEQNHTSVASFKKVLEDAKHLNLGEIGQLECLVSNLEIEFDKEINYSNKMFLRLHDVIEARSPKIPQSSPDASAEFQDSLHSNETKELIQFLRHVLLNANDTSVLTENEHFVRNRKIDLDKVNEIMANIFLKNNLTENKTILKRIKERDLTVMWKFFPQCDDLLEELPNEMEMAEFCKPDNVEMIKKLVSDVEAITESKMQYGKERFRRILRMISDKKEKLKNVHEELSETLKQSFGMVYMEDKYYSSSTMMKDVFNFHRKLEHLMQEIDLKYFSEELYLISQNISSQIFSEIGVRGESLENALLDILDFVKFRMGNVKWIKEFRHMVHSKKVKPYTFAKNVYTLKPDFAQQLPLKISQLRNILQNHNLESISGKKLQACENNLELQTLVEMLVLDILSVIEGLPNQFNHVNFYLDSCYPTAYGRNLRNHIAHGNALVDMLLGDNFANILLNAQKIINVKDILHEKIGKKVENDPIKSKKSFDKDLSIMKKQKQFFASLVAGIDEKRVVDFISEGVDIFARDLNLNTALHFAAKAPSLENFKCLLKFNLDVNAKNGNHQTALHVAADSGRETIVEFLIDKMKMSVDCKDINGKTPLIIASKKGYDNVVRLLLKHEANILIKDAFGYASLHHAVLKNHYNVVTVLLKDENDVNANQTFFGFTALHLAASMGHLNLVNSLLEKKGDVNFKSDMDYVPLHFAASGGHSKVAETLLKKGAYVNASNVQGLTPLHLAVDYGDVTTIAILLQHGADVNSTYLNGFTPFYIASEDGSIAAAKLLLESGASVNTPTENIATPLDAASYFGHCDLVKECLKDADEDSKTVALMRAASRGHLAVVKLLLDSGVDVKARSRDVDSSALHFAAKEGHKNTVKLLFDRGADLNAQDGNGDTALHLSSRKEQKEVVEFLLEMKADILIKDNSGTFPLEIIVKKGMTDFLIKNKVVFDFNFANDISPFHFAAFYGDLNFVKYCVENGCYVDIRTDSGSTALHLAVVGGYEKVIKFLLDSEADINAEDQNGCNALHLAVSENNKRILELLDDKGANLDAVKKVSLFMSAVSSGHEDIVDFFVSKNSDIGSANPQNDKYPIHIAVTFGHVSIVKKLLEKSQINEMNVKDKNSKTPLLIAVEKDHCEIAQLLTSKGADPDISSNDRNSPLLLAIKRSNPKMVDILLNSGADYLAKDAKGKTSIELAIESKHLNIVEILLQNPSIHTIKGEKDSSLMHMAASSGSLEIIESLVKTKVDLNCADSSGAKPIHLAAKEGHKEVLEYFLNLGIAVDEKGTNDWTLMHYAAAGNHDLICKFLSDKGANVNAVSTGGITPFHVAAKMGKLDAVLALLEVGAFYDAQDQSNKTPLEITDWYNTRIKTFLMFSANMFSAVQSNNRFKLVGLLLAGLEVLKFNFVNVKNAKNIASIHYAAWKGHERIVNILLRYRANPNLRTKNGWTALHYASKFSHYKIVKDLLCNGAVFEATSDGGKTPLHFSTAADIVIILELLKNIFLKTENKDNFILNELKAIEDMDIAKAMVRAKNSRGRTLITVAIVSNHPDVEELKNIFQRDAFIPLKLAEIFYKHGNYEESFNLYQIVLQKRNSIFNDDDPAVLEIQKQLVLFLIYYHKYSGALSLAQKVYKTLQRIFDDKNRETLAVKCLIGLALSCMGKDQEALQIYEEVSENQRDILGFNHKETLATLTSVAELLYKENKFEKALKINEEIFKTLSECYEMNPWTLRIQTHIAMILRKQEKYSEALEMFQNISEANEKIFVSNHPESLATITEIAVTQLFMGQEEESLKLLKKNVELQSSLLGHDHLDTLRSRYVYANTLYSQRRFCEALVIYTEDLNARILKLGANHSSIEKIKKKVDFINSHLKNPIF